MNYPYILEPTPENLQRYRREADGITYWHTADFWHYDQNLHECVSDLSDAYTNLLFGSNELDEDRLLHQIKYKIGRQIIQTARKHGVAPRYLQAQLDAYAQILLTPICIWKTTSGKTGYTLMSNLPQPAEHLHC